MLESLETKNVQYHASKFLWKCRSSSTALRRRIVFLCHSIYVHSRKLRYNESSLERIHGRSWWIQLAVLRRRQNNNQCTMVNFTMALHKHCHGWDDFFFHLTIFLLTMFSTFLGKQKPHFFTLHLRVQLNQLPSKAFHQKVKNFIHESKTHAYIYFPLKYSCVFSFSKILAFQKLVFLLIYFLSHPIVRKCLANHLEFSISFSSKVPFTRAD